MNLKTKIKKLLLQIARLLRSAFHTHAVSKAYYTSSYVS